MDGNKYDISIFITYFHNLLYPVFIVAHADQPAKYTYTMVYMDDIVSYIQRIEFIDGQLFTLIHATPYRYPMETVKNLVV